MTTETKRVTWTLNPFGGVQHYKGDANSGSLTVTTIDVALDRLNALEARLENCETALRSLDAHLDFSRSVESGRDSGLNFIDATGVNAAFEQARRALEDA